MSQALGATDLQVTAAGLGTVQLGMPYGIGRPSPPPDAEAIAFVHRALDLGIGYIDTAAAYGRSEELLGLALDGLAERPVVATKVALHGGPGQPMLSGPELRLHVETSVSRSLSLLRVDHLDLLQIHSVEDEFASDDLLAIMDDLCGRGAVRYWGATTYGLEAPRQVLARPTRFRTIQVAYSVLDRRLDREVLPRCRQLDVGVILRSVFLKGVLSDRRDNLPAHLAPLGAAAGLAADVAEGLGVSLPELALRFATWESRADVTLFGTTSSDELEMNVRALESGPLPDDAVAALRQIEVSDESLLHPGNWDPPSAKN